MNTQLFQIVNGWAGHSHLFDNLMVFFADKFLYVAILLVALLWFVKMYRKNVYLAAASVIVGRGIIGEILKRLIHHPRPFQNLNVHQLIIDNEVGNSFPSGHTIVYFALAFSFYGTKWFWPMIVLATIGSIARVFVGVHYPADVVGGFIVAGVTVWGIRRLFKSYFLS